VWGRPSAAGKIPPVAEISQTSDGRAASRATPRHRGTPHR
jgi:hypothetical protein